ncbi:MAG: SoxR reducing system RseC family protein [Thermodesulfobacteriota bacterium]
MATEEGIVIRVSGAGTWIRTVRATACDHCTSRDTCKTIGGGNDMEVEVANPVDARVGDRVMVSFQTASLLKATFLIYMFPIICLMIGAGIGVRLSQEGVFAMDQSSLSALTGFGAFVLAVIYVRIRGNRMAREDQYRPSIIRVLRGNKPAACPNQDAGTGDDQSVG